MERSNKSQIESEMADIKNISPNLATQEYLDLIGLDFSDFEGKNIASIGGGFGILEMDLAKTGNIFVEVVDPVYSDSKILQKKWKDTYNWLKQGYERRNKVNPYLSELLDDLKQKHENINQKIFDVLGDDNLNEYSRHQILYSLDVELKAIDDEIQKKKDTALWREKLYKNKLELLKNLDAWNGTIPITLKINDSFGEDIKGIEICSKDYVFMNHLLCHFQSNISIFLQQADQILKEGGMIYIVDYGNELFGLQQYFKHNGTYKSIGGTFCGALKKGEYKKINIIN